MVDDIYGTQTEKQIREYLKQQLDKYDDYSDVRHHRWVLRNGVWCGPSGEKVGESYRRIWPT